MKSALRLLAFLALAILGYAPALHAASTITYLHNDLLGSPVVATNQSGQVIWRESYRPFGERLTNAPASQPNDVWFTGRRQDVDTGLVYMGARFYDPVIGRFISKDPVGFEEGNVHSFNRYAYANNNPYRYIDPSGNTPADIGFALWDGGNFLGAVVAWGVGVFTGDAALQAAGAAGVRESRLDAGISIAAMALPISSGAIKGVARAGEEALEFARLSKKLASEAQMSEAGIAIAGAGTTKVFREAERVAAEHGGQARDWVKKTSSDFSASDGTKLQTRWVENIRTTERVEFKTMFVGP